MSGEQVWCYNFAIHPADGRGSPRALYDLLGVIGIIELEFTESRFEAFRSSLDHVGISLRDISRRPSTTWEPVS